MIWKTLLGLVLFVVVAAFGLGFYWIKSNKNAVAEFIKKNPERSSVCWQRNDTLLADIRSNKKMPLASTVKIIIAIEFAQQAANGKLNPEEAIPLSDLALFYIPDTDGGAHPDWLAEMQKQGKIQGNTVKLMEITKGMILFSSNANTEFLMQKLGLDNINANLAIVLEALLNKNRDILRAFGNPDLVNWSLFEGGRPMYDYLASVMRYRSGNLPNMVPDVRDYLRAKGDELLTARNAFGSLDPGSLPGPVDQLTRWIIDHRADVWVLFYGSLPYPRGSAVS